MNNVIYAKRYVRGVNHVTSQCEVHTYSLCYKIVAHVCSPQHMGANEIVRFSNLLHI